MKRLTSDYVVNECVRYILENPIEDVFTYVTLSNGMGVTICKCDRHPFELLLAKKYLYGIYVNIKMKAEHFGFGMYLQTFFGGGGSSRQIFLDKFPLHNFRVYINK
jgi:hypothetical protein